MHLSISRCVVILLALVVLLPCAGMAADPATEAAQNPVDSDSSQPLRFDQVMHRAAQAFVAGDTDAWVRHTERLHELRPHNQDFMRHLVIGYAQQGELSLAFNMMLQMQQQGLSEDWDSIDEVEPLRAHRLYGHLSTLMSEAGQPFGQASEFARLDGVSMPEALAHDPATGRLFVGTVREGRILVTENGEAWETFAAPDTHEDLMAVMSMAVDADRNELIVATGAVTQFRGYRAEDAGRTAILRLDLETGALVSRHRLVPDGRPRLLGSLAVAPDGTVFAADSMTTTVFRLAVGDDHPRPFFGHPNFTSLRGLALSDDGSRLYVADYDLGIFVVDARDAEKAWKLVVPETLNEAGIDGLYFWEGHLVFIQNGITPQRVMRLELGDDGLGVVNIAPVVAGLEAFDTPTFGVMDGSRLVFLAGSHWHHVDARGRARTRPLPPVTLLATDVEAPEAMVVGREILEQMRRQSGEGN